VPTLELALKVEEEATPDPSVVAVIVVNPPENVPLAADPGALNVTVIPLTGWLPLSKTVATSSAPNAVLMVALCGVPLVGVIVAGAFAVFVSEKFAAVATPDTVAATM
jgi:hypothetical protein